MSIYGTGNPNQRFASFQVGIGIPLFFSSQKANIKVAKAAIAISENNYLNGLERINSAYLQEQENYQKNLQTVDYYERTGLKSADVIIKTANQQFKNGEINYLNWVMLINNAISIQNEYLMAVNNLNESIINIQYLTLK